MEIKSAFIRKRNENYNVYIEYTDDTGKTKQKSQGKYKTKKEAEKHLIKLKNSINNQKFIICKDITIIDRCYSYVSENEGNWSHYTVENRNGWIKNHFEPFWKDTLLKNITVYDIQKFVNQLFKKFTPESSKVRYGFFRAVLTECYRLREIPENLCDFIKLPKVKDTFEAEVYTKEEVQNIIQLLDGNIIEMPILLMLLLGLRFGEACGLRWKDIDFQNNSISVNQIITLKTGEGFIFKDPKTESSKRVLHAPEELIVKIKKLKGEQNKLKLLGILENPYNLVCLNKNLNPWSNQNLTAAYKRFLSLNNIRKIRLHDLRHTNATIMLLSGTNMKTVSNRLGHTDIKISMNKYSHVLEEMDKEASNNLSQILFK